ncbi:MAG: CHC2 zinc finger domain-containing protein [Acidimicrobiales bacterium]
MTGRSPSLIAAAVERHRLSEVARRTDVSLPATTGSLTVCCPLPSRRHPDRSPSMRLYLDDDRYYCFGCGAKGDVVQWVRDAERIGVGDAVRLLDSRQRIANAWAGLEAGVGHRGRQASPSSGPSPRVGRPGQGEPPDLGRTPAGRVRAALRAAWDYYTTGPRHELGVAYPDSRGIELGVFEAHNRRPEVGHTPVRSDGLAVALRADGYSDEELVDAGLAYRSQGGGPVSDFYRQRALVPSTTDVARCAA